MRRYARSVIPCLIFLAFLVSSMSAQARTITDMYGREVNVPDKITRVYSISPAVTLMLYSIDPDMIVGIPRAVGEPEKRFFQKSYLELPVLGGSSGEGFNLNLELFLKLKPDVLIVWGDDGAYDQKAAANFEKLGIPVVAVDSDGVEKYADTFDFLGKLLDREQRTKALSSYARKSLNEVKTAATKLPADRRVKVYNTRMGGGGLNVACDTSLHAELIPLAGGINPVRCTTHVFTGIEKINLEQVLVINPDVIISMDADFARDVYRDKRWTNIRAVKDKRVYLTPSLPINWFSGPPSHMGILGVQWLANRLYPQAYPKDIEMEAAVFIKLFFQIDLSPEEIRGIME